MSQKDRRKKAKEKPETNVLGFEGRDEILKFAHEVIQLVDKKFPPNTWSNQARQAHVAGLLYGNIIGRDVADKEELREALGMTSLMIQSEALRKIETGSVMKPGNRESGLYGSNIKLPDELPHSNPSSDSTIMPSAEAMEILSEDAKSIVLLGAMNAEAHKIISQLDQVFDLKDEKASRVYVMTVGIVLAQAIGRMTKDPDIVQHLIVTFLQFVVHKLELFDQTGSVFEDLSNREQTN